MNDSEEQVNLCMMMLSKLEKFVRTYCRDRVYMLTDDQIVESATIAVEILRHRMAGKHRHPGRPKKNHPTGGIDLTEARAMASKALTDERKQQ